MGDSVCCWLRLTPDSVGLPPPAGMLLPSSRHPTSVFICAERQRPTPFIRIMGKDAHGNEICKPFCESISPKSFHSYQLLVVSLPCQKGLRDLTPFPPEDFSHFRVWINFLDLVQQSLQDILGQGSANNIRQACDVAASLTYSLSPFTWFPGNFSGKESTAW